MILYFSATGNCKYIAACIAQATEQEMVSIVDCIRENRYIFENEMIGIISPTYYWGLPNIVRDFLKRASFRTKYLLTLVYRQINQGGTENVKDTIQACCGNNAHSSDSQ